jgi:dihydroorotate dehydrogenase
MYKHILRPMLFMLPPEAAQKIADAFLRPVAPWRALFPLLRVDDPRLEVDWCGMRLKSPLGLAAGFDKDCRALGSLSLWGFGYLVGGTVTEQPRPGNPKPRLLRYPERESLMNALGFPGQGLEAAARRLEEAGPATADTPVVVSIAGTTVQEVVACHRRLEPLVDAIEVNISSPNTAGLRVFHEPDALSDLIRRVSDGRSKPLMVKLPPYPASGAVGDDEIEHALSLARACVDAGVDALTVANSRPTEDAGLAMGSGGLSGRAIFPDMVRMVRDVRREIGPDVAINACGGIFSGEDAWKALRAGATTVQMYTALVYRGPTTPRKVNRRLLELIADEDAGDA